MLNPVLWLVGAAVHTAGWQLVAACELVNPFFEKTVRIQRERGHRVIDTGPYHYVRHPGYVGFALVLLSLPVVLDFMPVWIPSMAAIAAAAHTNNFHQPQPSVLEPTQDIDFGSWLCRSLN